MVKEYIIGVISDTHGAKIPECLLKEFVDCDLIIHLGDIGKGVLNGLSRLAPVMVVGGNAGWDTLAIFPKTIFLQIFKWRIFATHILIGGMHFCNEENVPIPKLEEYVTIIYPSCNIVLFGHTHGRLLKRGKRMLFVNSGAIYKPCDKPSIAKLFITPNDVNVRFYLDKEYKGPLLNRGDEV